MEENGFVKHYGVKDNGLEIVIGAYRSLMRRVVETPPHGIVPALRDGWNASQVIERRGYMVGFYSTRVGDGVVLSVKVTRRVGGPNGIAEKKISLAERLTEGLTSCELPRDARRSLPSSGSPRNP